MNNRLIMAALLSVGTLSMYGEALTPQQAWDRATGNMPSNIISKSGVGKAPSLLYTLEGDGAPVCYVFANSASESGYILLSADDTAIPLLGYSEDGTFDADNMPDNLRYWLDFYRAEIEWARHNGMAPDVRMNAQTRREIAPLCKTQWNQDAPYNELCPVYKDRHLYTGCVATAMAQAMKYYNWPEKGDGKIMYTTGTLKLPVNFNLSDITFDWANMLDTYPYGSYGTPQQRTAVAELMMALGGALKMDYKEASSSSSSLWIPNVAMENFNYSICSHLAKRNFYSKSEWEDIIYGNLTNVGPVIYSGMASDGSGHAFIVDGYKDGYYHLNWGWGGMSDGYFLLSSLDPMTQGIGGATTGTYGFVYDQDAVIDMRLPQPSDKYYYEIYMKEGYTLPGSVRLGQNVAVNGYFYSGSNTTVTSGTIGLLFTDANGVSKYLKGTSLSGMEPNNGKARNDVIIPSDLAAGKYKVKPVWVNSDYTQYDVLLPYDMPHTYTAEVANGKVTFIQDVVSPANVSVKSIEILGTPYAGLMISSMVTFVNTGDTEFFGTVKAGLFAPDAKEGSAPLYKGSDAMIDIEGGETCELEYNTQFSTSKEGTYMLRFYSESGNKYVWLGEGASVTLQTPPPVKITASDFGFANGGDTAGKATDVEFTYTVTCESGIFSGYMFIGLGRENDSYWRKTYDMPYVYVKEGESVKITMSVTLPATFSVGNKVKAELSTSATRKKDNIVGEPFVFTIVDPSGITDISSETPVVSTTLYNLQGIAVPADTDVHGHYIKVTRYADGTTATEHVVR